MPKQIYSKLVFSALNVTKNHRILQTQSIELATYQISQWTFTYEVKNIKSKKCYVVGTQFILGILGYPTLFEFTILIYITLFEFHIVSVFSNLSLRKTCRQRENEKNLRHFAIVVIYNLFIRRQKKQKIHKSVKSQIAAQAILRHLYNVEVCPAMFRAQPCGAATRDIAQLRQD